MPRSPSKLPPLGTESMCEPNRIGGSDELGAGTSPEDVAGRIDPRVESRLEHQVDHVPPAGDVGLGVRDTADAVGKGSARRPAEHAQRFDALTESRRIRPDVLDGRRGTMDGDAGQSPERRGREAAEKIPTCGEHGGMVTLDVVI